MSNYTSKQTLKREQKETVFLLSIGTFLEYFDLMLYVHMAVLLNKLFFPQGDKLVAEMFAIFTFCSTFVLRPIGGLLVGWIGDHIGRKNTIIITTITMAICCVLMATISTYAEIGIIASIAVISCRALQGFSSMGEKVGAQLYLAETFKSPFKYIYGNIISIQSELGGVFALIVASASLYLSMNWRIAFWIGAFIAIVGLVARTKLRETPEFIDYKRRLKIKLEVINLSNLKNKYKEKIKIDKRNIAAYFFIRFIGPVCFYVTYIYFASFMTESLELSADKVIYQNLKVSILTVIGMSITAYLLTKYHPVKMAKINTIFFALCLLFIPYCLSHVTNLLLLSIFQFITFLPALCIAGVEVSCFKYIPVAKRFTILATTFGVSSVFAYVGTSVILAFLSKYVGYYAILIIFIPTIIAYWWAIKYIEKLEIKKGLYYDYPDVDNSEEEDSLTEHHPKKYSLGEEYKMHNLNCKYVRSFLNKITDKVDHASNRVNIKLIEKAIIFAKKWHNGQFRKTGEPYYSHPLAVAGMVMGYKFSTNIIVAAILHDVVEDSACTVELIGEEFNPRIAEIVERLTRIKHDENHNETKLSIEEIMSDLIKADDTEAMLVKAIDRLHNLKTVHGMQVNKQRKTVIETLKSIIQHIAYTVDNLNIGNKLKLEEEMYQHCKNILKISK